MKKTILFSAIVAAALLTGCGSDGGTTYIETPVENLEEPSVIPEGDAIIVDGGESVTVTSSSIIVDCGAGGCGDVTVATEITDDASDNSDNSDGSDNSDCSGGGCGN